MGIIVRFPRTHARTSSVNLKPKTVGRTSLPKDANASLIMTNLSGAIRPRKLQLLTADTPTPANDAVAVGPPRASITSSTVLSMASYSSHRVNMSSLHAMELASCSFVGSNRGMAESIKSLAARLKLTREALELSAADLCRQIDCKPNRWSQYEAGERKITLEVANALCDEFGLSLDWIYRANPAQLPHALRLKMRQVA